MNGAYMQTRCPRCGAAAWGHPQQAVPCNACGQPVGPLASPQAAGWPQAPGMGSFGAAPANPNPYGAPPPGLGAQPQAGWPAQGQPQAQPAQGTPMHLNVGGFKVPFNVGAAGGGISKVKIIGGVILAIVLAVGTAIVKGKLGTTAKGNLSYAALGINRDKADPDKMISAVAGAARKWKSDAAWLGVNLQWVHADGTVDLNKGGAQVEYVSPNAVQSLAKSVRKDSIKKFSFGPAGVSHKDLWGATEAWKEFKAPPVPKCGIKDVVKILNGQGLTGSKTVRITFDISFADFYAWHVIGEDPKIDALYAFEDCSLIK